MCVDVSAVILSFCEEYLRINTICRNLAMILTGSLPPHWRSRNSCLIGVGKFLSNNVYTMSKASFGVYFEPRFVLFSSWGRGPKWVKSCWLHLFVCNNLRSLLRYWIISALNKTARMTHIHLRITSSQGHDLSCAEHLVVVSRLLDLLHLGTTLLEQQRHIWVLHKSLNLLQPTST